MDVGLVVFGCFGLASVVAIVAIYFGRSVTLKYNARSGFEVSTVERTSTDAIESRSDSSQRLSGK